MSKKTSLTPEQSAAIKAYFDDRPRVFRELFRVVDGQGRQGPKGAIVPLDLRPAQADYLAHRTNRDEILKARQHGFSTVIEADFALDAILTPNLRVAVIVQNEEAIPKFSDIFHNKVGTGIFDLLPEVVEIAGVKIKFRPTLVTDNISTLALDNGSIINIMTSGGERLGRGQAIHRAHLTEVAFWDNDSAETIWAAVEGAMPPDGKLVIESTAFGQQGIFYREWNRAIEGKSLLTPHFYSWMWEPGNKMREDELPPRFWNYPPEGDEVSLIQSGLSWEQLLFRRAKKASLQDKFQQEYPETPFEAFIATGKSIFTQEQIQLASKDIKTPGEAEETEGWVIWEEEKPDARYVILVDSSQGVTKDADYDAVAIVKITPPYFHHVATYMGRVTQYTLAQKIAAMGYRYNKAMIIPETVDGSGQKVAYILTEQLHYPRVYQRDNGDYGWKTTRWNKDGMIDSFKELIDYGHFITHDARVAGQMASFVEHRRNDGGLKIGATGGAYDDLLMALLMGAHVLPEIARQRARRVRTGRTRM